MFNELLERCNKVLEEAKRVLHKGREHCPWCGLYTKECKKMFQQIGDHCCKKCEAYLHGEEVEEGKVDYDKLRAQILIMIDDPRTDDEKIYRVLGREYDRQTIQHVLNAMRKEPKKVGPLE